MDGLNQMEIEKNDRENVLLAVTKDHADWHLLQQMVEQAGKLGDSVGSLAGAAATAVTGGPAERIDPKLLRNALQEAVAQVEDEEDEHLNWAREKLAELCLRMGTMGPAPSPERWQERIISPEPPLSEFHPAPVTQLLLEGTKLPAWQPSTISRDMLAGAKK